MTKEKNRLADSGSRERIRNDLDVSLVVEAAAGTGKTTELVARMIAVLKSGRAELDQLVGVTFTDAAAGELKLRLRADIERERQRDDCPPEERARLTAALPKLEEVRIGTIHSFCGDLLRERPVEAGIDPLFEVAAEDVAGGLFDRAFDRWFERQLADPGEGVRRILRRRFRDEGPRQALRNAAWMLTERRDFPTPWRRAGGFNRDAVIDQLLHEMKGLSVWAQAGNPDDYFTKSLVQIGHFVAEVERTELVRGSRDYDGLEARFVELKRQRHWGWKGYARSDGAFPKDELLQKRDALKARLDAFLDQVGADIAPVLRDDLWSVVEEYERLKERAGALDFIDLLVRARDLVRDNKAVRNEYQERFTHIFVDEFQDTDPLQAEILLLLSSDDPDETDWRRVRPVSGKLFIVGDPKQSIYRFRRADVALYESVKRQICESGGSLVELNVSFRSIPEIQEAVNAAFAPIMSGTSERGAGAGSTQARYVPLAPFRASVETQPSVVALPAPEIYSDFGRVVRWRIENSLPESVAAFVDWLVNESGWTVTERDAPDERVPVKARHVCLLFRRFRSFRDDVTREYVRALEARHLPHLLVGGSSFHSREEVEALRNALSAIERPEDELSVFATLKGPLFGVGDAALLAYHQRVGNLNPFRVPAETGDLSEHLADVIAALDVLRRLHGGRNRRPVADTISRLLAATRAHAGLAIWPTGQQALANVLRMIDLARRAERTGVISFRSFVDWVVDQAERGEASDAPIFEEGAEGVRIMTVHRAKGLEFPVVILADMTARDVRDPSRWVDPERGICAMRLLGCAPPELLEHSEEEMQHEREEAARVLYVAATRARDLLVVPVVGDEQLEGWVASLNPIVYPPRERARKPETNRPPGCPEFGTNTVLDRPERARPRIAPVVPGLHKPEAGRHRVAWWDPARLKLDVQESVALTQYRILEVDESGERSEVGIQAHAEWQEDRARVRGEAGAPTLVVATATERAMAWSRAASSGTDQAVIPALSEVGIETSGGSRRDRPHGARFGALVHAGLSLVDLDADRPDVGRTVELQARLLGATPEEAAAASDCIVEALAHPLLRRAAAARREGRCRRESPLSLVLEDGTLVEGVVDLAFSEGEPPVWTVVDFKTDVELGGHLEAYRNQVGLYVLAVERATGAAATGVLLQI